MNIKHILAIVAAMLVAACGGGKSNPENLLLDARNDIRRQSMAYTGDLEINRLFDWAELNFPEFFPKPSARWLLPYSFGSSSFWVSAYAERGNYLGITSDGRVFGVGTFLGVYDAATYLGTISDFLTRPTQPFGLTPQLLPDIRKKYDSICGLTANMQNAIPVDLNNDGLKDLLLPIWCFYKEGQNPSGPVLNRLVALIQTRDGRFIDATFDVFGADEVSIEGKNMNWVVADFNGDGKDDIILGTDKEDGRPIVGDGENLRAQTVSIMSTSGPKYNIKPFGAPRFGDNVIAYRNSDNKLRLLLITADVQVEVWEYDQQWKIVRNEFEAINPIQKNPIFLTSNAPGKIDDDTLLVNNVMDYRCDESGCSKREYRLELWSRTAAAWKKNDDLLMLKVQLVKAQTSGPANFWTPTNVHVARFEDKDYIDMGFVYDGCSIKINPNETPISLKSFLGDEIPGGYQGQTSLDANWRPPTLKIFPVVVSAGKLIKKQSIISENLRSNYYRMSCKDLNNDGYDDIIIELAGGGMIAYFNDKNGGFRKAKDGVIPEYESPYFAYSVLYTDLDNDGIADLLYYPVLGNNEYKGRAVVSVPVDAKAQLPLFKAARPISAADLTR